MSSLLWSLLYLTVFNVNVFLSLCLFSVVHMCQKYSQRALNSSYLFSVGFQSAVCWKTEGMKYTLTMHTCILKTADCPALSCNAINTDDTQWRSCSWLKDISFHFFFKGWMLVRELQKYLSQQSWEKLLSLMITLCRDNWHTAVDLTW